MSILLAPYPSYFGDGSYLNLNFASNSYRLADTPSSFDAAFLGASPKLTYGTTSNSTMTNSSGEIVWAPHNLVEESEDFSDTSIWLNSNMTGTFVAAPSETDPAGSNGAYLATHADTSVSGGVNMHKTSLRTVVDGGSSGNEYTAAAFFKKPTTNAAQYAVLAFGNNAGYSATATFDLTNVSVAATGTHPSAGVVNTDKTTIVSVGNGWYLCSFTVRRNVSLHTLSVNSSTAPGAPNYARETTGDGTSGVLVWGAHVYRSELGMAPVPSAATGLEYYVPTTGAVEYLPRVGHHVYDTTTSTWVNEGLLIESEARTNMLTHSEDFTDATWSTTFSDVAMDAVGPDDALNSAGTLTDDESGGTGTAYAQVSLTVLPETTYTFSVFAKADQLSDIQLRCVNFTTPANGGVYFDLSAGEVGNSAGSGITAADANIEDFGSGWYRCSITFTTDVTDISGLLRIYLANGEDPSVSRDGTSSVLIYGAQSEVGSTPSSYIPTTGSTVIRDAQTLDVPPAEFGWNSAGMSFAMEGRMTYVDTGSGLSIGTNGDVQFYRMRTNDVNYLMQGVSTSGSRSGQPTAAQRSSTQDGVSGSLVSSMGGIQEYAPGVLVPYNVSARHSTTGVQGANDGAANSFTATLADKVSLADLSAESLEFGVKYMGTIKQFRQWDEDIGETGIEKASS